MDDFYYLCVLSIDPYQFLQSLLLEDLVLLFQERALHGCPETAQG